MSLDPRDADDNGRVADSAREQAIGSYEAAEMAFLSALRAGGDRGESRRASAALSGYWSRRSVFKRTLVDLSGRLTVQPC